MKINIRDSVYEDKPKDLLLLYKFLLLKGDRVNSEYVHKALLNHLPAYMLEEHILDTITKHVDNFFFEELVLTLKWLNPEGLPLKVEHSRNSSYDSFFSVDRKYSFGAYSQRLSYYVHIHSSSDGFTSNRHSLMIYADSMTDNITLIFSPKGHCYVEDSREQDADPEIVEECCRIAKILQDRLHETPLGWDAPLDSLYSYIAKHDNRSR